MVKLVSFDVDGTLDVGDPPGPVPIRFATTLLAAGCIVGSCSDNTRSWQDRMWLAAGIKPHFAVVKHDLRSVRESFVADSYLHIGDRITDRLAAETGGFAFLDVTDFLEPDGLKRLAGLLLA